MSGKIILLTAATCSCLSVATTAGAQTRPGFEVGAQAFDYKYRERFAGESIAKDDGKFIGLAGSYVETIGKGLFLRATVHSSVGSVDYSSSDGQIEDVSQYIAEVEFHLGYDLPVGSGRLTAFTGLAGRALNDQSGGKQTQNGYLGFDREVGFSYIPVGLAARVPLGSRTSLKVSSQYNHILSGEALSKLSAVDPNTPDLSLQLKGGHGYQARVALAVAVGRREFSVGPFIRHWKVQRSESKIFQDLEEGIQEEVFEPANKTTEAGLQVSFAF